MKLFNLVGCTLLATQAAGRFLPKSQSLGDDTSLFDSKTIDKTSTVPEFAGDPDTKPNPDPSSDEEDDVVKAWNKALCSGQKIFMAMTSPADQTHKFITPPQSPWSGTLCQRARSMGLERPRGRERLHVRFRRLPKPEDSFSSARHRYEISRSERPEPVFSHRARLKSDHGTTARRCNAAADETNLHWS
jgi:hypothetical protein